MEIYIKVRNIIENNESPVLSMTYMCGGSFNQLNLKFPVLLKPLHQLHYPLLKNLIKDGIKLVNY